MKQLISFALLIFSLLVFSACGSESAPRSGKDSISTQSIADSVSQTDTMGMVEDSSAAEETEYVRFVPPKPVPDEEVQVVGSAVEDDHEEVAYINEVKENTYSGTYRSIAGVMDKFSCYCFNGGYLTLDDGKVITICFEKLKKIIESGKLTVSGKFAKQRIRGDESGVCPAGMWEYLLVDDYK
jgi:hypothetical protein